MLEFINCNLIINFGNINYNFSTYLHLANNSVHGDWWGASFTQEYNVTTKINCYFFVEKGNDIVLKITPSVSNGSTPIKYYQNTNMGCKISSWSVNVY